MRKLLSVTIVGLLAIPALVIGQGGDAAKLLATVREALGGDAKLAAVKTVSATGHKVETGDAAGSNDFEIAMSLPDRYMRKEALGNINGMPIGRTTGFNGDGLIEAMDAPMLGSGGGMMVMRSRSTGGMTTFGNGAAAQSPEELAARRKAGVLAAKQDFARLTLGMFAASFSAYPLKFAPAGEATSPDGKADVVSVTADGDFAAKLFIDQKTHLPLMVTWMDKEPVSLTSVLNGGSTSPLAGNGTITTFNSAQNQSLSREELQQKLADAQANARSVEYRVFYGDYRPFDGVKLPTMVSRTIDGKAVEALKIEKYKINAKLDDTKFETVK